MQRHHQHERTTMKSRLSSLLVLIILFGLFPSCKSMNAEDPIIASHVTETEEIAQVPTEEEKHLGIKISHTITAADFGEYTLKSVMLFDELQVDIMAVDKKEGVKRLVTILEGKNLTNQELDPATFIEITTFYQSKYQYRTGKYDFMVTGSNSFPAKLLPLKNELIFCLVEIPDEVADSINDTDITIKLQDQTFRFDGTVEVAYQYIAKVQELNSELEVIFNELTRIVMDLRFTISPTKEDLNSFSDRISGQKLLVDGVIDELVELTPPSFYKEGHQKMTDGMNLLQKSLEMLIIEDASEDSSTHASQITEGGEVMSEATGLIEEAREKLEFLNW